MRIGDAFPSKYLKASDVPEGTQKRVTISKVSVENVSGNDDPDGVKPVIHFDEFDKSMVLNKTNSCVISDRYGDETDEWLGKSLLLYASETTYNAKIVPCLRVKVPAPTTQSKSPVTDPATAKSHAWSDFKAKTPAMGTEDRAKAWKAMLEDYAAGTESKDLTAQEWATIGKKIREDYGAVDPPPIADDDIPF